MRMLRLCKIRRHSGSDVLCLRAILSSTLPSSKGHPPEARANVATKPQNWRSHPVCEFPSYHSPTVSTYYTQPILLFSWLHRFLTAKIPQEEGGCEGRAPVEAYGLSCNQLFRSSTRYDKAWGHCHSNTELKWKKRARGCLAWQLTKCTPFRRSLGKAKNLSPDDRSLWIYKRLTWWQKARLCNEEKRSIGSIELVYSVHSKDLVYNITPPHPKRPTLKPG
jgi:hypothetical protein